MNGDPNIARNMRLRRQPKPPPTGPSLLIRLLDLTASPQAVDSL